MHAGSAAQRAVMVRVAQFGRNPWVGASLPPLGS